MLLRNGEIFHRTSLQTHHAGDALHTYCWQGFSGSKALDLTALEKRELKYDQNAMSSLERLMESYAYNLSVCSFGRKYYEVESQRSYHIPQWRL